MEVIEASNSLERMLSRRADETRTPLGGGFELLPFCNMNCNMCYVRNNTPDLWNYVLSAEQWIDIARQAMDAGCLYILLTGGEPLLYPDFKKLYIALQSMGFILTINTNGTLIDEEWADFFAQYPPRRINITLYGAGNETYDKLCHLSDGFDRVIRAFHLLSERKVSLRMNVTLVKENRDDLEKIAEISRETGIPFIPTTHLFPPVRKETEDHLFFSSRMTPEEAAESRLKATFLRNPDVDPKEQARALLKSLTGPRAAAVRNIGFSCKASYSEFWINYKGEFSACGMLTEPKVSLLKHSFADAWKFVGEQSDQKITCVTCRTCAKKSFCQTCAASCFTETGSFSGRPEYLCRLTDAMIEKVLDYLDDEEKEKYRKELNTIYTKADIPLISIVVPVYNAEKYLKRCLDSILMQSFQSYELILVDDGSSDHSGLILDEYAQLDSRIHVIHQENKGVSAARNTGIRKACAPWLMFCDSDDYVDINWCSQLYRKAEENPDDMIMCNVWTGNELNPKMITLNVTEEEMNGVSFSRSVSSGLYPYVWNKIYRRDLIEKHEILFDETISFNEDKVFNDLYAQYCRKAVSLNASLCIHPVHEEGLTLTAMAKETEEAEQPSGYLMAVHKN